MKKVKGKIANPGLVKGRAVLVRSVGDLNKVKKGDILISHQTIPAMIVAMDKCAGVLTEVGGTTSHAAIVTRELGIPCIVGSENALSVFEEGDLVVLDAFKGEAYGVSKAQYAQIKAIIPIYQSIATNVHKGPSVARSEHIIVLHELNEDDRSIVGGKAARLGELSQKFSVPDGFVITTAVFSQLTKGLKDIKPENVQQEILACPLPQDILNQIKHHFDKIKKPVAVRSSAVHEDGAQASFAGQHDSILRINTFKDCVDAIKNVYASTFSQRALAYFEKHKIPFTDAKMAILVQTMVEADFAGVSFSVNPVSKNPNEIVIEAVAGTGDALVSGEATPHEFRVDKQTFAMEDFGKASQKPSKDLLKQIAIMTKSLEVYFNQAQDVEWAVAGHEIFLLQSRDITSYQLPEQDRYRNFIEACFDDFKADESWPLLASQINTYFDVDEAFEMQSILKKVSTMGHKDLKRILPRQACLKHALVQNGIVGLKVAHLLGIKKFSPEDLQAYLDGMIDLIKHVRRNDHFSNRSVEIWTDKELTEILKKTFMPVNDRHQLAQLISLADAMAYATYYDVYIAGGLDRHGPYDASHVFGEGARLLVYEYYDMKLLEIWPHLKDLPYKSIRIYLIYKGKRARIDVLDRPVLEPGFMEGVIAYRVESEPQTSIRDIIRDITPWIEKQTAHVESLSDLDKMRKGALLYHYTLKQLRLATLGYWEPKGVEQVVKRFGDEFIKKFGPSKKNKPNYFNILFDPRTLDLGEE